MTDPIVAQITAYAAEQLRGVPLITDPAAVEVEPASDPSFFPGYGIMVTGARPLEREAGLTRWELYLTVDGFVELGDGSEGSANRAALHAGAVAALMADDRFGGLIEEIDAQEFRYSTATLSSVRRLGFAQDFAIQFAALRTDLAVQA
jgi:hypothetical protein